MIVSPTATHRRRSPERPSGPRLQKPVAIRERTALGPGGVTIPNSIALSHPPQGHGHCY